VLLVALTACVISAVLAATPGSYASPANPRVIRPSRSVEETGRTYGQWSARWWQYVLSIPAPENPLLDLTGARCARGQSGPVFFRVGTFTTTTATNGDVNGIAHRSQCSVPEDRICSSRQLLSNNIHGEAPLTPTTKFTLDVIYKPLVVRDDD
jgi:hypothetical protein